jgi:hypothetical protein
LVWQIPQRPQQQRQNVTRGAEETRMKTSVHACLLVLAVFANICAQEAAPCEEKEPKPTAIVMSPVVGTCKLRDRENAMPQPVKAGQGVRGGQALQCISGARLKLQFCNSKAEKEISQNAPKWYVLPNVPSLRQPSGLVPAVRYFYGWECPPEALSRAPCVVLFYHPDPAATKEVELWNLYQKKDAKAAIYPDGERVPKQRFLQDMSRINLKDFLWSDVKVETSTTNDSKRISYVVYAHLSKEGKERSLLIDVTSNWILLNGQWFIVSHHQKHLLE